MSLNLLKIKKKFFFCFFIVLLYFFFKNKLFLKNTVYETVAKKLRKICFKLFFLPYTTKKR